jgi:glyoxylase-like metal-dependent hydrolase (beta-lactamase superfamily II)
MVSLRPGATPGAGGDKPMIRRLAASSRFAVRAALAVLALGLATTARADDAPLTLDTFVSSADTFYVTSTLILGKTEAVLVDAQLTRANAYRLVAKILDSKRTLKAVFVTHAHPDHVFGLEIIKQAFPGAKLYASPKVIAELRTMAAAKVKQWKPTFGVNLVDRPVFPTAYGQASYELEGQRIELISAEPGESAAATLVYVPSLKAVIAGDVVYSGVHPWLAETNADRRQGWLRNLEKIKALAPQVVVPGHRLPDRKDLPTSVDFTAGYVRDFDAAAAIAQDAADLQKKVEATYKDLQLPIILSIAAQAQFPPAKK